MPTSSTDPNDTKSRRRPPISVLQLALVALVVLLISDFLLDRSIPDSASSPSEATLRGSAPSGGAGHEEGSADELDPRLSVVEQGPAPSDSDELAAIELALERARDRYDDAADQVARAQSALVESERAVEDLERFIADLKARGEDPADHAEEGMALFRPALDAYEAAMGQLERAEAIETLALEERRSAEQRWAAARRSVGGEP